MDTYKIPKPKPVLEKLDMFKVGTMLTNQTPRGAQEIDYHEEAKKFVTKSIKSEKT